MLNGTGSVRNSGWKSRGRSVTALSHSCIREVDETVLVAQVNDS